MDAAVELHDHVGDALRQALLLRRQRARPGGEHGDQREATTPTPGMTLLLMGLPRLVHGEAVGEPVVRLVRMGTSGESAII